MGSWRLPDTVIRTSLYYDCESQCQQDTKEVRSSGEGEEDGEGEGGVVEDNLSMSVSLMDAVPVGESINGMTSCLSN